MAASRWPSGGRAMPSQKGAWPTHCQPSPGLVSLNRPLPSLRLGEPLLTPCDKTLSFVKARGPSARGGRGLVAEWLRRGLQILPSRFDSGRGLHHHLCLLFLLEYCRLILPLFSTTKKSCAPKQTPLWTTATGKRSRSRAPHAAGHDTRHGLALPRA